MSSRFSVWRAFFLLIGVLVLPALACSFSASTASITNSVMAKDVKGDNVDPVGITDTFPANASILHAVVTVSNAPSDTAVKVVWLDSSNNNIGEYELKTEGSRNLDFTFKPDGGTMPAGSYKAEIYLNGKLDRTLNFMVAGAPAPPTAAAKPTVAPPTSPAPRPTAAPPTTSAPKPSGYVNNVTLAESTTGDKEPVNPTIVFKSTATFHAVVRTQNAPANTKFKASWYVVDVGNVAPANSLIDETELATDGSRNIDFSLAPPPTNWPGGTYRVGISVNGVLDRVVNFSVSASSSGQPTTAPPTQAKPTIAPTPAGLTCGNGVLQPGMVGIYVTNNFDGELLFAIASRSYKIPGHSTLLVQVPGGNPFTYSATITGVGTLTAGPYTFDPGTCVPFTPQN